MTSVSALDRVTLSLNRTARCAERIAMEPTTMNRIISQKRLLSLAVLTLAGSLACGGDEPSATAPDREAEPVSVTARVASFGPVGNRLTVTGSVEPIRRTMPGTKIMGRVERVPVDEGQKVPGGALLAVLESRDLVAAVRQAEAAVAGAEAQLANADAQFERMRDLEARGSATRKSLEDATSAYRMAEAGVARAESNLEAARVSLGYAEVRTPFGGWVVDKRIEEGDMVQPGAPLFTVEDLDPVKVIAEVPSSEVSGLAPGDRARVEVTAVEHRGEGEIVRIVPSGDRRSRIFRVEIHQPNPDGVLNSGMFARVTFDEAGAVSTMRIPVSAVVRRGQLTGVFVVEADAPGRDGQERARLRWVRIGERRDDGIVVLSGLSEGERYVLDPPTGLVDGTPLDTVEAAEAEPATTTRAFTGPGR